MLLSLLLNHIATATAHRGYLAHKSLDILNAILIVPLVLIKRRHRYGWCYCYCYCLLLRLLPLLLIGCYSIEYYLFIFIFLFLFLAQTIEFCILSRHTYSIQFFCLPLLSLPPARPSHSIVRCNLLYFCSFSFIHSFFQTIFHSYVLLSTHSNIMQSQNNNTNSNFNFS